MPNTIIGYETKTSGTLSQATTSDNGTKIGLDVKLIGESSSVLPEIDVNVQDQATQDVDLYLHQVLNTGTLLFAASVVDSNQVTLTGGHGAVVGNSILFQEGSYYTQGIITAVATDLITIDSPLDRIYTTAATITLGNINLAVNGSVTPVIFQMGPLGASGDSWDITRMMGNIIDNAVMDDAKFGGITALTNGLCFRRVDGTIKHLFNVKTNGEIALRMYDTKYSDKAPSGFYGFSFRRTWAGQGESGVVIRLDSTTGDTIQCVVQDDLTGLTDFHIVIQGHVVEA